MTDPKPAENSPALGPQPDDPDNEPPADSLINTQDALRYWGGVAKDDSGMLGAHPQVSRVDLLGSLGFLTKLRRKSKDFPAALGPFERAVDCGAGIGRVTKGFLTRVARVVDVVEPVEELSDVVTKGREFEALRRDGQVGEVYNVGLEDWTPEEGTEYELIWHQWCLSQLTDRQLVDYLKRIKTYLVEGGWIVIKEDMSTDSNGQDIFNPASSSVTRSDVKFRKLFEESGLRLVATELQKGMPLELYPVRSYALMPVSEEETGSAEEQEVKKDKKRKARKS